MEERETVDKAQQKSYRRRDHASGAENQSHKKERLAVQKCLREAQLERRPMPSSLKSVSTGQETLVQAAILMRLHFGLSEILRAIGGASVDVTQILEKSTGQAAGLRTGQSDDGKPAADVKAFYLADLKRPEF